MKNIVLLFILLSVSITGCKRQERIIPEDFLQEKDGVSYTKNSSAPFSGIAVRLYPSGAKKADIPYFNGKKHGSAVFFDRKGVIVLKGTYTDNLETGRWFHYKENKIVMVRSYVNGKEHGETLLYDKNGEIELRQQFENGLQTGEEIEYYPNGKIASRTTYKGGKKNGEFHSYYQDEKLKETASYKDGNLHGEVCAYSHEGKITMKGVIENGSGDVKVFDATGKITRTIKILNNKPQK